MAQLTVKDLVLGWDGIPVASGISFEVNKGDYLAVVGENGSGKSTLMKVLLGLASPLSGDIIFSDGLTRSKIGYLPQQTLVQRDFPASAFEIVISGFSGKIPGLKRYTKEQRETALSKMELLGIEDLKDKCYRDLSGGQQQRILLARALCATEEMLILDEPVSGLDPSGQFEMYGILHHLNHNLGVTIIMISHDIEAVDKYADKVLRLGKEVSFK